MNKRVMTSLLVVMCFLLTAVSSAQAQNAPPLVEALYNGNWPSEAEAQDLLDELYYQRAIHTYITMLPALNTIGMRDGSEATFGKGYNVLPIWKDRMDSRCWVPKNFTSNRSFMNCSGFCVVKPTSTISRKTVSVSGMRGPMRMAN